MKLENLIVQYLYKNKSVRLQDIGTFSINPDVHIPADSDKELVLPQDSIKFEYDPRAKEDEGLINYVIEQTRKIRPLATSDLESFSNLNRQFINIGKPLVLEGIGSIAKTKSGDYEFAQGKAFNTRIESGPVQIKEKAAEEVSFEGEPVKKSNKTWLWVLLSLLVLGALGSLAYYFYNNSATEAPVTNADTATTTVTTPADTSVSTTVPATTAAPATSTNSFKVVLREFITAAGAQNYVSKLESYGHRLDLRPNADSTKFTVLMPIDQPVTDSVKVRDSVKRFFGGNPYIVLQ